MGPSGIHDPNESEDWATGVRGQGCGVLRAQLQLGLIRSATKFGGGFPVDQTAAEEPFVALFDVVGVGIGDGAFRNGLLRALRLCDRNGGADKSE